MLPFKFLFLIVLLKMTESLVLITEEKVKQLLIWEEVADAVEDALKAVTQKRAVITPRSFTPIPGNNVLLSMPGYVENGNKSVLVTKLVTSFVNNEKRDPPIPSILANIFLFDTETGEMKAVIEGREITAWRTAAASVVATKYLHNGIPGKKNEILGIIGAGAQGRIHAIALQHFFNFSEVRIWNRTPERSKQVVEELIGMKIPARFVDTTEECVKDADVIVTATYASTPLIDLKMIKNNVHINAIGAGQSHYNELNEDIYRKAIIYTDHEDSARVELKGLYNMDVHIQGEVGNVIVDHKLKPDGNNITVFQSLGMAAEDGTVGQLIYDRYMKH